MQQTKKPEKPVKPPGPAEAAKPEKKESESVRGLKIVLESLRKAGHGPDSQPVKEINALIAKF